MYVHCTPSQLTMPSSAFSQVHDSSLAAPSVSRNASGFTFSCRNSVVVKDETRNTIQDRTKGPGGDVGALKAT